MQAGVYESQESRGRCVVTGHSYDLHGRKFVRGWAPSDGKWVERKFNPEKIRPLRVQPAARERLWYALALWVAEPVENAIVSLNRRDLEYLPHQFRPLLTYLRNPRRRLLIADEVGTGKTVAAGYIIAEEVVRRAVSRIVVVCPASLELKWRLELRRFFALSFSRVNARLLLDYIAGNAPFFVTVSQDAFDEASVAKLETLAASGARIDLLCVDEVHHMIGRSGDTIRRRLGKALSTMAGGAIGLSATPIQVARDDLVRLLSLLDGSIGESEWASAIALHEELASIVQAQETSSSPAQAIDRAVALRTTFTSRIGGEFLGSEGASDTVPLDSESTSATVAAHRIHRLSPLADWITRTRKRDVGLDKFRDVRSSWVDLDVNGPLIGPMGKRVRVSEDSIVRATEALLTESSAFFHRMVLASDPGNARLLLRMLADGKCSIRDLGISDAPDEAEAPRVTPAVQRAATELRPGADALPLDSKWRTLQQTVADLWDRGVEKLVVFTQWMPTLGLLRERARLLDVPCFFVSGAVPMEERTQIANRFSRAQGRAVLFTTGAMSEGIDLFAASAVINYDMPTNPQRVEQRIGRVDRIGQIAERIFVRNLFTRGTVDERIHELLIQRIGIFEQGLGGMEDVVEQVTAAASDAEDARLLEALKQAREAQEIADRALFVPKVLVDEAGDSQRPGWLGGKDHIQRLFDGLTALSGSPWDPESEADLFAQLCPADLAEPIRRELRSGRSEGLPMQASHPLVRAVAKALVGSLGSSMENGAAEETGSDKIRIDEVRYRGHARTMRAWFVAPPPGSAVDAPAEHDPVDYVLGEIAGGRVPGLRPAGENAASGASADAPLRWLQAAIASDRSDAVSALRARLARLRRWHAIKGLAEDERTTGDAAIEAARQELARIEHETNEAFAQRSGRRVVFAIQVSGAN